MSISKEKSGPLSQLKTLLRAGFLKGKLVSFFIGADALLQYWAMTCNLLLPSWII